MKQLLFLLLTLLLIGGCGKKFERNPLDDLIRDMEDRKSFSIILHDMDVEGNFSTVYRHQYKIIEELEGDTVPQERTTEWMQVPEEFFWEHENNMGMEVAAKSEDGKVSKAAAPPGYHQYVGNSRYGHWDSHNGNSFWVFYGQYAMMRSLLGWGARPVYQREYTTYNRDYRGRRSYYGNGSSGSPKYGTNSAHNKKTNPNFFERRKRNTGWRQSSSSRTGRSSSRYSGSKSGSRSRGYGK